MKKILIALLLVLILVSPVIAWSSNLNNGDITIYQYPTGATVGFIAYPYPDSVSAYNTNTGRPAHIIFPNGSTSAIYVAWDSVLLPYDGNSYTTLDLLASGGSIFYGPGSTGGGQSNGRYELVRTGSTTANVYVDGVFKATHTIPTNAIYSWGAGAGMPGLSAGTIYIDDPTFGNAASDTGIISVMPHNWYILKDSLNPAHYGQYDNNNNLVSSSAIHMKWSIGAQADGWSIAAPPDTRYTIRLQSPSGVIAYNEYVDITTAGHAYGYVTIPINGTYIGDAPISYGTWFVTLYDGATVKSSDYFSVVATGAAISWDRTDYTTSDTAYVDYAIDGSYYIPADYTYKITITDIYGATKATTELSTDSGTESFSLNGYEQGVTYANLWAVDKSTSVEYLLGTSATTISSYVFFNGYVMDAVNGTVLSGANVNVAQSLGSLNSTSGPSGWVSSNNWLTATTTITTTKTGYTADVNTLLPIASSNISINISLIPTTVSTTGIVIGGIVRESGYHSVVPGATYHVGNVSTGEAFSATTNIAGYAIIDGLVQNRLYSVYSSKTGYGNSPVTLQIAEAT